MLDVTSLLKNSRPGSWRNLSIPLSCFAAAGADLSSVEVPFAMATSGRFSLTLAEVSLAPKTAKSVSKCPGTR